MQKGGDLIINGLVFNQAFWIKRTPEVANKLNNYDNLQAEYNGYKEFHDTVMNQAGKTLFSFGPHEYGGSVEWHVSVQVSKDGKMSIRIIS